MEPIKKTIRRELNRAYKGVNANLDEIGKLLENDVFKREITESDKLKISLKKIQRAQKQ